MFKQKGGRGRKPLICTMQRTHLYLGA